MAKSKGTKGKLEEQHWQHRTSVSSSHLPFSGNKKKQWFFLLCFIFMAAVQTVQQLPPGPIKGVRYILDHTTGPQVTRACRMLVSCQSTEGEIQLKMSKRLLQNLFLQKGVTRHGAWPPQAPVMGLWTAEQKHSQM